jgi:hypothetical protein
MDDVKEIKKKDLEMEITPLPIRIDFIPDDEKKLFVFRFNQPLTWFSIPPQMCLDLASRLTDFANKYVDKN